MKRVVIGLVVAVLMAGCGGSDNTKTGEPTNGKPSLSLLTAAQACAQVQQVNDELHGPGKWPIPTYGKFGEETKDLAGQSVPELSGELKAMSDQALKVGRMSGGGDDVVAAASEWASRYQAVADICARTSSPIGRLP